MLHKWSLHLNSRMSYTNALFFSFVFFPVFSYPVSPLSLTGSQTRFITHFTEEKTKRSYMAQDSLEIQVHNGPPPFLLYQLQAASKPRPTQDEQEMQFFSTKNGMPLQKLCQALCRDGPRAGWSMVLQPPPAPTLPGDSHHKVTTVQMDRSGKRATCAKPCETPASGGVFILESKG